MSELFLVRLGADESHWFWKTLQPAPEQQAKVHKGTLDDARNALKGQRLIVMLPGQNIARHPLELPLRGAKLLAAAPYALEDALAEDVDTLHFALAPQVHGRTGVYVVRRDWLAEQLERIQQLEPADIVSVVPEHVGLMVAEQQSGAILLATPEQAHIQTAQGLVGSLPPAAVHANQLQEEAQDGDETDVGISFISIAGASPPQGLSLGRRLDAADILDLPLKLDVLRKASLLQGAFAPKNNQFGWLKAWRRPAGLAAAALLMHLATVIGGAQQFAEQTDAAYAEAESIFRQLFPQEQRIVDMRLQASQYLAQASGSGGSPVLELMDASATGLAKAPSLELQTVQYRGGALYLSLTGKDLQALESLRNALESNPSLRLDVQSAQAGSDGVQIRLKLEKA